MILGVDWDKLGGSCSGLLTSDFRTYSKTVAAVRVISKASLLYAGFNLSWGFPPEHTSPCDQAPSQCGVWVPWVKPRTCKLPVSEGLGPESGVAFLTYILLVRQFQRPDSRRGDREHHLCMAGVSKNVGAILKKMETLFFKFEVPHMNSFI